MVELLVLGPEGSGKSMVIRGLNELNDEPATNDNGSTMVGAKEPISESTIPTVGVNLSHIEFKSTAVSSTTITLDVREIGAAMASRWDCYLEDCAALLFVIDVSDLGSLASSFVLLYEVLSNKEYLANKPLAILLNKLDLVGDPSTSIPIVYHTLRIDDLQRCGVDFPQITVLAGSALDLHSSPTCVRQWILDKHLT
jgi:GTPase SAR1 family protein